MEILHLNHVNYNNIVVNNKINTKNKLNKYIKQSLMFVITFLMLLIILSDVNLKQVSSVNAESFNINYLITKDSVDLNGNKSMLTAINKANKLPFKIKQKLYDNNYKIKIQKDIIQINSSKTKTAQGVNDYKNSIIIIADYQPSVRDMDTNNSMFTECDSLTLLHEIGHLIDKIPVNKQEQTYQTYSDYIDFIQAYTIEKNQLFDVKIFNNTSDNYLNYFRSYRDEYFAEVCALYFNSNNTKQILKNNAPLTYNFIKNNFDTE